MQCSKCLLDSSIPGVDLDANSVCNFCNMHVNLNKQYPLNEKTKNKLRKEIIKIKKAGKKRKYDCLFGLSGGCDSSYLLHLIVKEFKLRPLIIHCDNGWNSEIAEHNIKTMVEKLGVDFIRYRLNKHQFDELNLSFLNASVSEPDAPSDVAMLSIFMETAVKYKIKYVFNGHDFRSEGSTPLGWTYLDGKYINDVYKQYTGNKLINFPDYSILTQLKWALLKIKAIRPLYYIEYDKKQVKQFLQNKYGWLDYGGHHCENLYTMFLSNYLLPKKFGIDKRLVEFSALIRSGRITKEEAKNMMEEQLVFSHRDLDAILFRLNLSSEEFDDIMREPRKTFKDFKNYHKYFVKFKWLIWIFVKMKLFPKTFYIKYTKNIQFD